MVGRLPPARHASARAAWAWCTSRRPATAPGSRSRCCARTSSATTRPANGWPARWPPCVGSPARDRRGVRRRPVGRDALVATRYVPGLSLHEHVRQEGPVTGDDLRALRGRPGRGDHRHAPGRGPAPRHQAVQRAARGPLPGADRLRAGPARGGPAAHPRPAGCSAPPATSRPRSSTATTPPPPPTCTRGPRRWCSPRPAGRPSAPVRRWRSWTGSVAASTTCPVCRPALLPLVRACLAPDPARPPRYGGGARVPAGAGAGRPHDALRARRAPAAGPAPTRTTSLTSR